MIQDLVQAAPGADRAPRARQLPACPLARTLHPEGEMPAGPSPWTSPTFYLSIPLTPVLFAAVWLVRKTQRSV